MPLADSRVTTIDAPVNPGERHDIIDIIRGFALFGIMLANIAWIGTFFAFVTPDPEAPPPEADIGEFLVNLLTNHKFYTLFSILFGLGFAMQLARAQARGSGGTRLYARRLFILLVMGTAHALLLWFGDILHTYALLGFVLILFSRSSDRTILRWAIALAIASSLLPTIHVILHQTGVVFPDSLIPAMSNEERVERLSSGRWADIVAVNWNFLANYYTNIELMPGSPFQWYLSIFWKFLLGLYIGRRMLLQRADEHRKLFHRAFPWLLGYGLLGNFTYALGIGATPLELAIAYPFVELSFFALSMAYLCALVMLYQWTRTRRLVELLAPVGRMALTNYVLQSIVYVVLFYGVGLGQLNKLSTLTCQGIALGFFIVQIVLSCLWLRVFRFGPLEWLWRWLTYGKRQPMVRVPSV